MVNALQNNPLQIIFEPPETEGLLSGVFEIGIMSPNFVGGKRKMIYNISKVHAL